MSAIYDTIFFFTGDQVVKTMLFPEFEALLDGFSEVKSFSNTTLNAVFTRLDEQLDIKGIVFCKVPFDDQGLVDSRWNLRLPNLLSVAEPSLDFGHGAVKTVSFTHSSPDMPKPWLWDADEQAYQQLIRAIAANAAGVPITEKVMLYSPAMTDESIPTLAVVPTLKPASDESDQSDNAPAIMEAKAMKAVYAVKLDKLAQEKSALEAALAEKEKRWKNKTREHIEQLQKSHLETLKQKDTLIATLRKQFSEELSELQQDFDQKINEVTVRSEKAYQKVKRQLASEWQAHLMLKEKAETEKESLLFTISQLEHNLSLLTNEQKDDFQGLSEENRQALHYLQRLTDKVSILEVELNYRNEQLALLRSV